MLAVGHFALGYLTGKIASKFLNVDFNLPLLFFVSVFPDIDLLITDLIHRGLTHSLLFSCIIFIPLFLLYRKHAVVYFVALVQHSVIGDFLAGGAQLLWPLSSDYIGLHVSPTGDFVVVLELMFFLVSIAVLFKTRDVLFFLNHEPLNLFFSLLVVAVLLPCVVGFRISVPSLLLIPHAFYLLLFSMPLIVMLMDSSKTENS